jgi:hypothetical protein
MECKKCGYEFEIVNNNYECPECQHWNGRTLKRKAINVPSMQKVTEVESRNHNGVYEIYRLPDGTHGCTCLSFLFNRGTRTDGNGIITCKHIRDNIRSNGNGEGRKPVSVYQNNILKKFGVQSNGLTNDQAYFIINKLLEAQGLRSTDLKKIVKSAVDELELIPFDTFGCEFELYFKNSVCDLSDFGRYITDKCNVTVVNESYNHSTRPHWKIVYDGSVSNAAPSGYFGCELVSRKQYGAKGIFEIFRVLKAIADNSKITKNCGFHIHVDFYKAPKQVVFEMLRVWNKIEPIFNFLVPDSRINNTYCKAFSVGREDATYYKRIINEERYGSVDRYKSINIVSLARYGTIEFRKPAGTTNPEKAVAQILFFLKLVEKVKRGATAEQFPERPEDFDRLLDFIGLKEDSIWLLARARQTLLERFAKFAGEKGNNKRLDAYQSFVRQIAEQPNPFKPLLLVDDLGIYKKLPQAFAVSDSVAEKLREATYASSIRTLRTDTVKNAEVRVVKKGIEIGFGRATLKVTPEEISCTCSKFRELGNCGHIKYVAKGFDSYRNTLFFELRKRESVAIEESA